MHTQTHQVILSIPVVSAAIQAESTIPRFPDDDLLRDVHGDVLIVQAGNRIELFSLQRERQPVKVAARFIAMAQKPDAIYLVGGMTSQGGRFRSITRVEAFGKIGERIFEEI